MLYSFYGERGLKNRQILSSELGKLSMSKERSSPSQSRAVHRSFVRVLYSLNPADFFLFVSRSTFYELSFPFFYFFISLLYGSVAPTLKNVGPLDCNLSLLRRWSISFGGTILVAEFMHLTFSLQTQRTFVWFLSLLLFFFFLSLIFPLFSFSL